MPRSPATADPAQTRADLVALRPDLVAGYDAELPGARAAVLARLIGALDREDLPGLVSREHGLARFEDGTQVGYPIEAAAPFARGVAGLAVRIAGAAGLAVRLGRGADAAGLAAELTHGADTAQLDARLAEGANANADAAERRPGLAKDPGGLVVDDPGTLVRLLWPAAGLAAEVDNSVANMALARARRPAPGFPGPHDLGRIEQLVVDGHPLHPCCRTRGGMTVADVLAYAPEHSPVIRLRRLKVPADRWYGTAPPVLYAHPWQALRWQDRYPWLVDDGETGPVRPLMSLRTVAPLDGGAHVKTAVDVQMTSAVRTVSPAAVHNGPILSALIRRLTADLPIEILAETEAGAVIVDGRPQRHLAFLRREAPSLRYDETAIPMATLSASPVLLERVHDAYGFMVLLGEVLFAPLLELLRRGIALEAHGQNTLVVLRDGRPQRILYRDLGGVRVSAHRLRTTVNLEGDLPSDDPQVLRDKLAATAISTVAAELIAAFTRVKGADPARLWAIVAQAIRAGQRGGEDAGHILHDKLPLKATTAMRLASDPLEDRWARIDNPMAA